MTSSVESSADFELVEVHLPKSKGIKNESWLQQKHVNKPCHLPHEAASNANNWDNQKEGLATSPLVHGSKVQSMEDLHKLSSCS